MAAQNLKMTRGDTKTLRFTVSNLPPTGLTGFTFWFTAKNQVADLDAAAVIQKTGAAFTVTTTGSDTVPGVVQCTLASADTETLADYPVVLTYDFQMEAADLTVTTAASGTLTVSPDVTRAR